jgi:hypothetical protein
MPARKIVFAATLSLVLAPLFSPVASGQDWARKMFTTTSHDFGTVASGAKAVFEFPLKNIYLEDVHIESVRASCGCTIPSIKADTLKTYQQGAIVAVFNTDAFRGNRGATLTVTIDQPYYAEVQLQVRGYIRGDIVLDPGSVRLGTVDQGTPVEKKLVVNYAGRSDWRITGVRSNNPFLSADVRETGREGIYVNYQVVVRLDPKAPPGYINEHLMLTTSDSRNSIPVPVEGVVQAGITVSPSQLMLGVVQPGQKVTKQIVVRSKKPFTIVSIAADGEGFEFDTSKAKQPKTLHLIPVTYTAGKNPGSVTKSIRIETDLADQAPVLSAFAVVRTPGN